MITKTQLSRFANDKVNSMLDFSDVKFSKNIAFMGYYATDNSFELRTRGSKGSSKGALFYQGLPNDKTDQPIIRKRQNNF